mgnify:FL=1
MYVELRLMQDVVISRFASGDGVAVSVVAVGVFLFVDVGVTVQVGGARNGSDAY